MVEESVTRQLTAIFYADVSGYSRLTEADELETHHQLSASLDIVADRISNSGGEVVHYAGDAVLARFASTVAAINCAIGIQNSIRSLGADVAAEKRLLFRIGINVGEVIVDRDEIYGDGVNIAARIETLAIAGGICISESVFEQVHNKIDVQFVDMGAQRLKNIERPVRTYRVVTESDASGHRAETVDRTLRLAQFHRIVGPQTSAEAAEVFVRAEPPSIMLLPFRNLGDSVDQDAWVDGLRLSIQASLVKLPGLFLINVPVPDQYRYSDAPASQVANDAGVRYVLDGAVHRIGERLRVTVQLTDAPAARVVWADRYDRIIDDVFAIQDDITTNVAVALNVTLLTGEDSLIWWANIPSRKARELVLRGISHLYMGSESGNAIARGIFEELNELVPQSTQALALAAYTDWLDVMRGWSKDPDRSTRRAVARAEKAIELGDPDGFAHVILGSVRLFERRHDEALALAEKAVSSRINCPMARAVYSNVLHFSGQHGRAIENVKIAIKHARIYPPWTANVLSGSYRDSGQLTPSIAVANECLRIDPQNLDGHVLLCTDYSLLNAPADALRIADAIRSIAPEFSIARYVKTQPYKSGATADDIARALRVAGLPG